MSCTIDHLLADHRLEIIQDFKDARGVAHSVGESGVLRRMGLDWARQEIQLEWERNGTRETMFFSLRAKEGPRNGGMREFFALHEYSPAQRSLPVQLSPAVETAPELSAVRITTACQSGNRSEPFTEVSLGEVSVACDCDPKLHRYVLVEPRNINVAACLCCGTVTCTKTVGDDGRFHGNAWHAYLTVDMAQSVVDWLALWPRVKVTYCDSRWPMSSLLVRRDCLYYPANTRCQDVLELTQLEERLIREQSPKTPGQRLRDVAWPRTAPPAELPTGLSGFVDVWETLHMRTDTDFAVLARKAQLLCQASPLAVDLLWQRPDAADFMLDALRSSDDLRQSAGYAMARDVSPPDPRLAGVIIEILYGLSFEPLTDVPGRIVGCGRFESLLVLIADLKLCSPEMFGTLEKLKRRLIRRDTYLVKYIDIVVRELKGDPVSPASSVGLP